MGPAGAPAEPAARPPLPLQQPPTDPGVAHASVERPRGERSRCGAMLRPCVWLAARVRPVISALSRSRPITSIPSTAMVRSPRVPSQVPSHPQTAAKVRGFSPIASGFTAETDWLLEGGGFEPSVPCGGRRLDCFRGAEGSSGGPIAVRTRLTAGGKRIRTLGPTVRESIF
jgi:hypothetical protein